ncbi:MAG: signal recognition particle-docking protein FtsY [Candidatus Altiarchaeota archaeon]|nr:signal recognition particle-docking protein FtsY [Candidatus Altiarchaeota archaeon]
MLGFLRKKLKAVFSGKQEPKAVKSPKKIKKAVSGPKKIVSPQKSTPAPVKREKKSIFKLFKKDELVLEELELSLLECGVALEVIEQLLEQVKSAKREEWKAVLKREISKLLMPAKIKIKAGEKPYVIMLSGINGTGKTTTLAKLAKYFQNKNKSVVIAAADTFRSAAIEQLKVHCDKLGIKMITHQYGADPAAVAFDAIKHAEAKKIDVVLIDTSGRMHVDTGLMKELEKVKRVAKPHLSLLTVDSTTGNDAVEQARAFSDLIDGVILTKFDVDERGGALISVSATTGKPTYFLATGQKYNDLESLNPKKIVAALGL